MRAAVSLCALALIGCGAQPNQLGGSVSELFPLQVSRVEAVHNEEALQLTYLNNRGRELDIVLRLTVALGPEEVLTKGTKLPLEGLSPQGFRRATLVHVPGGEPSRDLGEVQSGQLIIDRYDGPGTQLEGEFGVRFVEGTGLAAGRNAFGGFDVEVEDGRVVEE